LKATGAILFAVTLAGCAAGPMRVAAIDELERVRAAPIATESATVAPEAFARAEAERALALQAHAAGDDTLAMILADHAIAAYQHALVVVRLAKATTERADAQKSLDDASTQVHELEAQRVDLDRQATELEQRVQIARQRILPAESAQASGSREAARLVAARSMAVEARMLCGAARLVSPEAPGLTEAEADRVKVDGALEKAAHPVPIDDAARARVECLDALTRARRAHVDAPGAGDVHDEGHADLLLAELSATGKWDPSRDERGVVVTLRDVFRGKELASGVAEKLQELGRVAAAHPDFAVQVVVHDAEPPAAKDDGDSKRAEAATKALVDGGAAAARIDTELAGARAPVVDPADRKLRPRNERVEIVFVPLSP
jgi:flagellar motor protein MotB